MESRPYPRFYLFALALLLDSALVVLSAPPNDPDYSLQWGLRNTGQILAGIAGVSGSDIDAEGAWAIHFGARRVVVAILGTGINPHEEFADRLLNGYVSPSAQGDPYSTLDTGTNGTRAAGIIAAARNNGVGIAGINDRALLLPVRVALGGAVTPRSVAEGIVWAADHDAEVILVLVQLSSFDKVLVNALDYAHDHDCLVVAASGHTEEAVVAYPAALDHCIAVSVTTHQDKIAAFSNYGPEVDISAPGLGIWSTAAEGGYGYEVDPTSHAASAFVAGVASLVRSFAPQLTVDEVRDILLNSADDLGEPSRDDRFGAGRINARRALETTPLPLLRFESVDPIPRSIPPLRPTRFEVRIASVSQALDLTSPELVFRTTDGPFDRSVRLDWMGSDIFSVPLPPLPCGTTLEFFLLAATQTGLVTFDPVASPLDLYGANVDPRVLLFADDFEEDRNWETSVVGGESVGAWERVAPAASSFDGKLVQPGFDRTPNAGRRCFVTGQYLGGSAGQSDVDGGPVILTSPTIELGTINDVSISYSLWFVSRFGETDSFIVEFSRDGGDHWAVAEVIESNTNGWEPHGFRLVDFPSITGSQLRVRFFCSDDPSDSLTEAGVDEFRVDAIVCDPIPGDFDLDGFVDWEDWENMEPCLAGPDRTPVVDCNSFDTDGDLDVDLGDAAILVNGFSPLGE